MNNVTTDGNLDWSSFIRVPATPKQVAKYSLLPGDVLFNSTERPELVGKTTIFDGFKEPVAFSNHFLRLRVRKETACSEIPGSLVVGQMAGKEIRASCYEVGEPSIGTQGGPLNLEIPLPPLAEQQRIANILGRADRLRRLRRYALELSEGYLQAVF